MKKILFLSVTIGFLILNSACTRSAHSDSTKIQIKLPSESSVLVPKAVLKTGGLVDPTTLDEINCYGVFVGGPDDDLKNKTCALGSSGESFDRHTGGEMVFGDWRAAVPAGQVLSMDVKSGVDRVIYLVGMKATEGSCVDFRENGMPDDSKTSSAFLLGIAGRLELKAGAETTVSIPMNLNSGKTIVGCRGDDLLRGGDGKGGGGSDTPYLRFEGIGSYDSVLDVDKATVDECYSFRPALFKGQGAAWTDTGGADIHMEVSGLNIGQFYSGIGCTTPVSDLVIPAGQNRSIAQYYFKSTTAVTGSLANIVFSGNTEAITGAQQKFDIGQRKIVISGPNRIILNECYPYKIMSSRHEGGFLNTSTMGANGTLSEMASFQFRTGSDCTAGTSANIAPYNNETTVHLKLLSPANFNLGNYLAMSGYATQQFMIDSSIRGDHYNALTARFRDDKIVRGECNDFAIHLINDDGGAVKARVPIDVKLKPPQGAGVFFLGAGCVGSVIDRAQIQANDTNVQVSFKAYALPSTMLVAGKLPIFIDSGSLKLNGIGVGAPSIAWVDIFDSNSGKVILNPPGFSGAQIVGSHEFTSAGSVLEIPLLGHYTGLVDVQCSATSGTGFSSCSAAEVDRATVPYKYKWTAANAASNTQRFVRFAYSGYTSQDVGISATHLYGPKFKVVNCTAIGPAGVNVMPAVASLNAQVLCLPANSLFTKNSSAGYSLEGARHSIIGHSTGTSVFASGGYLGNLVDLVSVNIGEDRFIANLKLDSIASNSTGIRVDSATASVTAKVYVDNVNLVSTNASVMGIYLVNVAVDLDISFALRNIKIDLSGASSFGALFETASRIVVEDSEVSVSGGGSYGIKLSNTSSVGGDTIEINNSLVKVIYGIALAVYNTSTSTGSNNSVRNSRFLRSTPGNAANEIVRIEGKFVTSKFDGNLVMAEVGAANTSLMYFLASGTPISLGMSGNTLVQSMTSPGVVFDGINNATEFSKNSFAYTGVSVNNTSGAVRILTSAFSPSSSSGTSGGNIGCGITGNVFTPFHVVASGSLGGSVTLGTIPVLGSNVVSNTGRCRGP